jgi:hypothetical protein
MKSKKQNPKPTPPVEKKKSTSTSTPDRKLTLPRNPNSKSTDDDVDNLYLEFLSTGLMQDWEVLCDALRAAEKSGKQTAELPLRFLLTPSIRDDILHVPTIFSGVIEEWNRVCDQQGMPQEKKNTPGPEEPTRPGGEKKEPF